MNPLYGHSSPETAYIVDDYPYGRLRCQIKFWLETDPKKGFRFVSQTTNPKNGRVNAPKKSTYCRLAGAMFLDENQHCHCSGLSEYSSPADTLEFVKRFPGADFSILRDYLKIAIPAMKARADGRLKLEVSINGVRRESSPESERGEREDAARKLVMLEEAFELIDS